jgi:uncharacterized RDD family membrane protein YckC
MQNNWYYAAGGKQAGPVSEAELDALAASGTVNGDTLVWREGLADWQPHRVARPNVASFQATSSDVAAPAQAAPAVSAPDSGMRFCSECGQRRLERELVTFGDRLVCFACKDAFAQRLRQEGGFTRRFQYAGFWIRFLARMLDAIVLYIIILPVTFLVLGSAAFRVSNEPPTAMFLVLNVVLVFFQIGVSAAYEVYFLSRHGATPGKMVVGKKVVTADGGPLSVSRALGRHFAVYLSSFTLAIGFIMAAFDDQKRALHDRICDPRVISK